ncbi:MAG: hypothetical protein GEU90_18050 [Gemmatimonas sp.]|nr:hypothetical protein [Gemmatimonas sp.]
MNRGDPGLIRSLDRLSAEAATVSHSGGATIAAHIEHVRYALMLMNRWAAGENPFADANWAAAWEKATASEVEWDELRRGLRDEVDRWHSALRSSREVRGIELDGVIGSIIHLAYHLGAIRQIDPALRGPTAD